MHRRHLHFSTGETRSLFQHSRDAKPSLLSPACPDCPLLRREVESLRPPGSGEVICCLAGFLGESRDSGLRLGLDAWADNGISSGASRTIRGKSRDPLPFSRSGLIMGDFAPERRANVSCAQDREESAGRSSRSRYTKRDDSEKVSSLKEVRNRSRGEIIARGQRDVFVTSGLGIWLI